MGQFDWFRSIGATPEAVAVLNDQPILFTILLIVLVAVILQIVLLWYIHFATLKPEQKKKKEPKKGAAKGSFRQISVCVWITAAISDSTTDCVWRSWAI
ncbi:hypothetical protein RB213_013076 [Colletotrichum asianum]|uniref:Uncharacterized protein n=2 Tax=Colletotrichum gloeosporioides species complex TaxID=2707338 RepID=A0A8H3WRT9_9PEZI|nr:hypothetical protein GQ607_001751 [Colletotrichum asianum]